MKLKAGVIGNPISHSKSPRLHNYWLKTLNIDGEYQAIYSDIHKFRETVYSLIDNNYQGVNVTIPFKEEAYKIANERSLAAKFMGAANTLVFNNGKIFADNTDGYGFAKNIQSKYPDWNVKGDHIILGAGGAAKAIIQWLIDSGANRIILFNRTRERAEKLAEIHGKIEVQPWDQIVDFLPNATTLVQTTSCGMNGKNDILLNFENAKSDIIINDIVYTPLMTGLLKSAKNQNIRYVDGLGMLLWQARPGFEYWFGQTPPKINKDLRQMMLK